MKREISEFGPQESNKHLGTEGTDASSSASLQVADIHDKFSALPDDMLTKILSHLETKEAVATSCLSKRWEHVHKSLPNITLRDTDVLGELHDGFVLRFAMFGIKQLGFGPPGKVKKLSLECETDFGDSAVQAMVRAAANVYGVKEIDLSVSFDAIPGVVPTDVFTSASLVVLKLREAAHFGIPDQFILPKLEVVQIENLFLDEETGGRLHGLLAGSPRLHEFHLSTVNGGGEFVLKIDVASLQKLWIDVEGGLKVLINAPRLVEFGYRGFYSELRVEKNALFRVELHLVHRVRNTNCLLQFVEKLQFVRTLYLSWHALISLLPISPSTIFFFGTLTRLEVGSISGFQSLIEVLQVSNEIQVLVLHKIEDLTENEHYDLPEVIHLESLKMVVFIEYEHMGCQRFLTYLLNKCLGLKKLIIGCDDDEGMTSILNLKLNCRNQCAI